MHSYALMWFLLTMLRDFPASMIKGVSTRDDRHAIQEAQSPNDCMKTTLITPFVFRHAKGTTDAKHEEEVSQYGADDF